MFRFFFSQSIRDGWPSNFRTDNQAKVVHKRKTEKGFSRVATVALAKVARCEGHPPSSFGLWWAKKGFVAMVEFCARKVEK
jgi:hypothetical protein